MDNAYQWVDFYEALADRLLEYNDKRGELFELMKKVASEQPLMKYLHFEREDWWEPRQYQIDPFSVMGVMNRGTTDVNRTVLAKVLAKHLTSRFQHQLSLKEYLFLIIENLFLPELMKYGIYFIMR